LSEILPSLLTLPAECGLYWFDDRGQRYLAPEEQAQLEAQQAQLELERYRIHFGSLPEN